MIKDLLVSFKDNINTKTSNPFFGTFVLVWITKNWNLIYSIFNFDSKTTLEEKRTFIDSHFTLLPSIETLLWCVLETFIILVVSYILINLARLIVNFFDKQITPLMYKWTDENSIVLKSIYDISENERKRLEKRVEEEREAKLKLQEDYDKLEKRIAELLINKNSTKKEEKEEIQPKGSTQKTNSNRNDEKVTLLLNKMQKENKTEAFEKVASAVLNNNSIEKANNLVEEFSTLGLIVPGNFTGSGKYRYTLSQIGKDIHDKLIMEKLK
jgi:hypothetical protein